MLDSQLLIEKIFSHFDEQIKSIIPKLLGTTRDKDLMWIVAEDATNKLPVILEFFTPTSTSFL
jgi:hypothetical protein